MSQFTENDAKELNIPIDLLKRWEYVMNTLWAFFKAFKKKEKALKLNAKDNEILFKLGDGKQFFIGVNIYNSRYLSLYIKISGNEDFGVTISKIDHFTNKGIIMSVSQILTAAEEVNN